MSRRVVLAWEYGRNLGHISRLLAISKIIEALGGVPVWFIPEVYVKLEIVRGSGYEIYACPMMKGVVPYENGRIESFADILLSMGFGSAECLTACVQDWMEVIRGLNPDRVVVDYAPAAQLAAFLLEIKTVQISNGFDAPPADCPAFDSSVRGPYVERKINQKVEKINEAFRGVGKFCGYGDGMKFSDYINNPIRFLDCIPETDPYPQRKDGVYIGPLDGIPDDAYEIEDEVSPGKSFPENSGDIFAYLRGIPDPRALLDAICAYGINSLCVWPDIPDQVLSSHRVAHVRVVRAPVKMKTALERSRLVINYGSTTTINKTLLMGRPQLMIPGDLEKKLAAQSVSKQGAGMVCGGKGGYLKCIEEMLISNEYSEASKRISKKYGEEYFEKGMERFFVEMTD